jgi:membrane protease YdiL (CAAX protease family)
MSTADQAAASASESIISIGTVSEEPVDSRVSRRRRIAGLLIVLTVAFLPSVVSSLLSAYREPLSNFSDSYIRLRYLNSLIRELISLTLLAYVIQQNRQKFAEFGLTFRARDIVYGIFLWAAATSCYRLAYPTILSTSELLGWHRAPPYIPDSRLGLDLLTYCFVVVNPVYEEMIVRAFLMCETIALTGSFALAILFSVLLQTSYHIYQGLPYALCAGVSFLIFSIYYAHTKRIVPVILAHFIWDLSYHLTHSRAGY